MARLRRVLTFIGKPFYFLLTRLVLFIAFIFYILRRPIKIKLGARKKVIYQRFTLPKFKFPKIKFKKIKRIKRGFLVFLIFLAFLILNFYFFVLRGLPSPKDLTNREPEISTKIYDRNGNLLYKIYNDKNRTLVHLTQIPPQVRFATLAAEDAEFYSHPGFSIRGIFRAITTNLNTGSREGGSTITQQLVKNTLLTPEKTILRKIKEIILSIEVEASYTKDQILEMYLNEVPYGGTTYGIEEASRYYFGKNVEELTLPEAAFLAGLPKSPTLYSPFGQNPDLGLERQKEVLHLMVINKYITREDEAQALSEKLTFAPVRAEIKAPHFVMYVRDLLVAKYGESLVEKGGLEVVTSLDLPTQILSEEIVKKEVDRLKNLDVGNGAALVINPSTGEILAMVGSKNYFDIEAGGNVNVLTRLRQPGSSIKVVNYAYALENGGYTPASVINDSPITYVTPGSPPYSPVNYDGEFKGNVTLRSALAQSRNIPAVKVLASYGVAKMIEEGKALGITTWTDPSLYGLSLTLGGGAVKGLELAKVYATIANYGKRPELIPILSVKDYKGKVLEKNTPEGTQVLDPRVAFSLIDILKDNNSRAPEFGTNSYLVVKDHPEVAVKTGTSNDLRDNWAVGFNQNFLVLTWVGNNDNSPMNRIASGVTGASPIWNKIMSAILNGTESIDWKIPDKMVKINCQGRGEWFKEESVPANYCRPTPTPDIKGKKEEQKGPRIL